MTCEHAPSPNPRSDSCVKCGKPLPVPPPPDTRHRDIESEREVTYHAAKGAVDPTGLITHAETRAGTLSDEYVSVPSLVSTDRDRILDAREEITDCRNHLVWWLQDNLEDGSAADKLFALRLICLAYDLLKP